MKLKIPVTAVVMAAVLAYAVTLPTATGAHMGDIGPPNALNMNAFIDDERAKTAALELAGGGRVTLCRLSYNQNAAEYEIGVLGKNAVYSFIINAYTGKVESFTRESTQQTDIPQSRIGDERAKAAALEVTGDGLITLLRLNQNIARYEVGVLSGNAAYLFTINAYTGKVESFTRESATPRPSVDYLGNRAARGRGSMFDWPLRGPLSSPFGQRMHPVFRTRKFHYGIDIAARKGTPVMTAAPGEVLLAGWMRGYGQIIIIDHGRNFSTIYAHLSSTLAKKGQVVNAGAVIGTVGDTGTTTGYHLHFEIREGSTAKNPLHYLRHLN